MPMWFITAPANDTVDLWQTSHGWLAGVGMWLVGLPLAVLPWQLAQLPAMTPT